MAKLDEMSIKQYVVVVRSGQSLTVSESNETNWQMTLNLTVVPDTYTSQYNVNLVMQA